jgi:hypothetical protein
MNEITVVYQCNDIGITSTTPVHVIKHNDGIFEARCGFALIGITNMKDDEFAACDYNPFHEKFYDNYAVGKGVNEECALSALKLDIKTTADSLWI